MNASTARLLALFPVGALAGCPEIDLQKYYAYPQVGISSHGEGDVVVEGVLVTLRALVLDGNHSPDVLSVSWWVDGAPVCPDAAPDADGRVTCAHRFARGGGEVELEVIDPDGYANGTGVRLSVQASEAPIAQIAAPTADGVYYGDELIVFEGLVSDAEDALGALTVAWASSLDGPLVGELNAPNSEGALLGAASLSEGEHLLTLSVTDTTGKEDSDSVTIRVEPARLGPTTPTVVLAPSPAYTDDTLEASASGSVGGDGAGPVSYGYTWYEDGALSSDSTSASFPAADTVKHRSYRVVVVPTDSFGSGPSAKAEITVQNTAPVLLGPSLSPSAPRVGDTLT